MKGLKDNEVKEGKMKIWSIIGILVLWVEIVLCLLFVYQWGVNGLLWWIALMSIGWAMGRIITQ